MWCLETIKQINEEAYVLSSFNLPESFALENCGIRVLGNTSRRTSRGQRDITWSKDGNNNTSDDSVCG
jgi:hypothetical protein